MKTTSKFGIFLSLLPALCLTAEVSAQELSHTKHHQYELIDVGTFGGPASDVFNLPSFTFGKYMNQSGTVVGFADTPNPDPYAPNCLTDCYLSHALRYKHGQLTDLGSLPGSNGSAALGINENGVIVGASENGSTDPATGFPEFDAVLWERGGRLVHLPNFGGSQSQATMINNQGLVAGVAANTIPDPYASGLVSCIPLNCGWTVTTQQRAVVWENGKIHDLGTLGGNDAVAYLVNEPGEVAGVSYTNTIPNITTGVPTQHAFLWQRGRMLDIGSLGGTVSAVAALNNQGQVAGYSTLAGDQIFHSFLWTRGKLTDFVTLGGSIDLANGMNEAGTVVGDSTFAGDQLADGFAWRNGTLTALGAVGTDNCSNAIAINNGGQIVGESFDCGNGSDGRAALWENGEAVDLNVLVDSHSDIHVQFGLNISDDGSILAGGFLLNGDLHLVLLVPHGGCDGACEQRTSRSGGRESSFAFANSHQSARPNPHTGGHFYSFFEAYSRFSTECWRNNPDRLLQPRRRGYTAAPPSSDRSSPIKSRPPQSTG